jgi:hypothetical protein
MGAQEGKPDCQIRRVTEVIPEQESVLTKEAAIWPAGDHQLIGVIITHGK